MDKHKLLLVLLLICLLILCVFTLLSLQGKSYHYARKLVSENPAVGFAPSADYSDAAAAEALVYAEVRWSDFEPQEGVYDFDALEQRYHFARWRAEGKHLVLRFVCDVPGSDAHFDIPAWLYQKTQDGTVYDTAYGKGYAPDYTNDIFIAAHAKAIGALGAAFAQDNFLLYVELGSLGHWGEWHVMADSGLPRIPPAAIRQQYIAPYLHSFSTAKLLMRRPFAPVSTYNMGVYNDMTGHAEDTNEWLDWLQNGGEYTQPKTPEKLVPATDIWMHAPVGGEFTSSIPMQQMLGADLSQTLALIKASHMTFIGPKCPHTQTEEAQNGSAVTKIKEQLGYQIAVCEAHVKGDTLTLTWQNYGAAPLYWDWPVFVYQLDAAGQVLQKTPVSLQTTALVPGEKIVTKTALPATDGICAVGIGIEDPLTQNPAVQFAMQAKARNGITILYECG
ncbi:MAG: DUF4832 domain-containing protein [Ruthenibacterium sp.]